MGYLWTFSALPTIVGRMGWIIMGNFGCFLHTSDNCRGKMGVFSADNFMQPKQHKNYPKHTDLTIVGAIRGVFALFLAPNLQMGGRWGIL